MSPASIDDIKKELQQLPPKKILDLLLKLGRFKKENKELLTYLLFEQQDEMGYTQSIKIEIDEQMAVIGTIPAGLAKKVLRKIQRQITKQNKYMASKPAAVELHLHFARRLKELEENRYGKLSPEKVFVQQAAKVEKLLPLLTEDLRHDYEKQVKDLQETKPEKRSWWKR
jgi:hypothetical protein